MADTHRTEELPARPVLVYSGLPLTNMALRRRLGAWSGGHIYIFWGCVDEPIYVGMSVNVPNRFDKHRRRDWWPLVEHVELYHLPRMSDERARDFARRLHYFELAAIECLRPSANIAVA